MSNAVDHTGTQNSSSTRRTAVRHKGATKLQITGEEREHCHLWLSRKIVDNKVFVFITTLLTFYALVGDDVKLIATNKPADRIFDILTIVCLLIFSFEIVVSCLGKSDYFLGFFFILDVVSTSTLILDISTVSELVMGDGEDLEKLRSGRTARGRKSGQSCKGHPISEDSETV